MPMPTNCIDCPACNEYLTCAIPVNGRKWGENDVREFSQSRPEWCPLKEPEGTINELQNAYGYLQKQFFEAQDKLLKEQEARIRELEEKLRVLRHGDQDALESAMMPAT